jgi:hypothetical protein
MIIADNEIAARAQDSGLEYLFMNDTNIQQDVISRCEEENLIALKAVQRKYHLAGVFS